MTSLFIIRLEYSDKTITKGKNRNQNEEKRYQRFQRALIILLVIKH